MMENHSVSFLHVESVKPSIEQAASISLGSLCLLSLLWGAMMKSIVFCHFSETKIWSKPINVLILVDELIFVISGSYILIQISIWLLTQTQGLTIFESFFGIQVDTHWYCSVYISIASFHYFYGTLGSFGISVHRYVLVMKPHLIKGLKEEKIMLSFILLACLTTNLGLVVLYISGNTTRRTGFNACLGRSEKTQVFYYICF